MRVQLLAMALIPAISVGCGTSKWTDTSRTATEQLLISDAMDRAVSELDVRALAGKTVFIDDAPLKGIVDSAYLISTFRQHLLANGALLKEKRDEADYVVEVRAGAVGTDRHDVLFGVPATTIPSVAAMPGVPSSIPEIPLMKKTEQQATSKIAVFAYNRKTGRPVWQSGVVAAESKGKDFWVFGAGPFQRGNIYEGTEFAPTGGKLDIPLVDLSKKRQQDREEVSVADEAYFVEPAENEPQIAQQPADQLSQAAPKKPQPAEKQPTGQSSVVPTGHTAPAEETSKPATSPPVAAPEVAATPIPHPTADPNTSVVPTEVPLTNTPPITATPPEIVDRYMPVMEPPPSRPASGSARKASGIVVPLPPVVTIPEEAADGSVLDRLLRFRR